MDKKIVAEMDQKVIDQQNTLEKAGVPGFFITTNPQVCISCCLLIPETEGSHRLYGLVLQINVQQFEMCALTNCSSTVSHYFRS